MFTGLTSKSSTSSAGNSKSGALREPDDFPPYELTSAGNPFMLSDDRLYPPMRGHSISYDHIPLRQTLSTSPRHRADSFASGDGDSSLLETSPHLQYRGEYASDTHPIHTSRGVHVTHQDIASPPFTQVRRYATPIETSVLVSSYPPEPNSATTATSSSHDGDSEAGTLAAKGNAQPPPRQRKNRREKPHIELAPDQPPTTQGKPRCRVYVACAQW
jgi:hypothetical protein